MNPLDLLAIRENALIEQLTSSFSRSPFQVNGRHETDAEILDIPGMEQLLVLTVDAIVEEIELGLYHDPALIGWMTVTSAASDLAAVGADPVGLLLVEVFPHDVPADYLKEVQLSIRDASLECGLPVLGGDTNHGEHWLMSSTAVGLVPRGKQLTRQGARPGEVLFATGALGAGTAFAAARLLGRETPSFRPHARLEAGIMLRRFATCSIDTSDGALASLDQLMRLNRVGFSLGDLDAVLHPHARRLADELGIPEWTMLAGLHGEFELLFTVPAEKVNELTADARAMGWEPVRLGTVAEDPTITVDEVGRRLELDTSRLRSLFDGPFRPMEELIEEMLACRVSGSRKIASPWTASA